MAKIIRLTATNVKRLRAVTIEPTGAVVTIAGKNGAGKSSTLDAIQMVLGGKKHIPPEPLRKGAKRGKIEIELDDPELVALRTFGPDGRTGITVTLRGEEVRSPQTILDRLCKSIAFDPLEYSRMKPDAQAAMLRELIGLDTTALDKQREGIYEQRTEEGRELKRLKAQLESTPEHADAPAEEVKIADLTAELERRGDILAANANARRAIVDAAADVCARQRDVEIADAAVASCLAGRQRELEIADGAVLEVEAELARITARLAEVRAKRDAARAAVDAPAPEPLRQARSLAEAAVTQASAVLDAAKAVAATLVDPDLAEVRTKIAGAEATNRKVRDNQARAKLEDDVEQLEEKITSLSDAITAIDDQKAELLAKAKLPVAGLGFDAKGVTLNGVPLEQASQAERLRVSVGIGLALNPTLKVLLVRDGSLLDGDSLAMVAAMAEEAGAQVWLERVGEGEPGAVIIEDGEVKQGAVEGAAE